MADFSVTAAVGAGFRVIGRKPLAVVVWGLFTFLCGLPLALMTLWIVPEFWGVMIEGASRGFDRPSMDAMMQLQAKISLLQPVSMVTNAVQSAVLAAAVFRAVLTPQDDRFFYLRFGARELWLVLLVLVIGIFLGVAMVLGSLIGGGLTAALAYAVKSAGTLVVALVVMAGVFATLGGVLWPFLRLSMAAPMTFDDGHFRLFESWTLTRGHAGRILGLGLLLGLLLFALVVIIYGAAYGLIAAKVMSAGYSPERLSAFLARPPSVWLADIGLWVVLTLLVFSFVNAALMAIWYGAWAHAYRQLRGEAAA